MPNCHTFLQLNSFTDTNSSKKRPGDAIGKQPSKRKKESEPLLESTDFTKEIQKYYLGKNNFIRQHTLINLVCVYIININFYAKVIVQIIRTVQVACYFIDRTISKTSNQTAMQI